MKLPPALILAAAASLTAADEYDHRYKAGDKVDVFLGSMSEEDGQLSLSKRKADEMKAWEEKRRAEMEAEGMSVYKVMERARLLNPSTMIYPKESCVHQMPPIDPVTKKLINPETGEALPDDDPAQVEHLKLRAEVLKPWYERDREEKERQKAQKAQEKEQKEQPAEPATAGSA